MKKAKFDQYRDQLYKDYRKRRPFNKGLADKTKDLSVLQKDYAIHLPAAMEIPFNMRRWGVNEEHGQRCVDFPQKDSGAFHYGYVLYSAGHAKTLKHMVNQDLFITRDPETILFGDSGGYQAAIGSGKHGEMDWSHIPSVNELCQKTLTWLETTSNYSMILDLPTFVLGQNDNITSHEQCLQQTM